MIDSEVPRSSDVRMVSPGYLRTMGIPLLVGRGLTPADDLSAAGVVVVNRAFARRFFGGAEEALGRRIQTGGPAEVALYGEPVWREIVGVVGDLIHDDLTAAPAPEIYVPLLQHPTTRLAVALRASGEPTALSAPLRDAVLQVDPDQPVYDLATMQDRLGRFLTGHRIGSRILGGFSGVALALAVLGIYSVVSYTVALRRHELGVRVALGAGSRDVLALVVGRGMRQVVLGLAIGLLGAWLLSGLLAALLFEVSATDPATLPAATAILLGVGLAACWLPARRALSVDPMEALQAD